MGSTSAGAWGVWAKQRGGVSLGTGARQFPLREKVCPHSACTHPQRAHCAHTHTAHAARHDTYTVICTCVTCGAVALCRHVNE